MKSGTRLRILDPADFNGLTARGQVDPSSSHARGSESAARFACDRAALNLALLYQGPRPVGFGRPALAVVPVRSN
jgi:hypothetical protein